MTSLSSDYHNLDSASLSSNSHMSVITTSALSTISEMVEDNKAMIEEYEYTPGARRVSGIRKKMRNMEIQHYRAKCVKSLRRSLELTKKIDASDESSHTSSDDVEFSTNSLEPKRSTAPPVIEKLRRARPTIHHLQTIMEVARDIFCV